MKKIKKFIKSNYAGYIFISPVLIGILVFLLIPMLASLYFSFCEYDFYNSAKFVGIKNYVSMFTYNWPEVGKSLQVTALYSVIMIPLSLVLSFMLALFLNKEIKGIGIFRVLYYLPVVIPSIVSGLLWRDILEINYGLANAFFEYLGLPRSLFLNDSKTAMLSLITLSLFGLGGSMVLWLAQLKTVPKEMYEAANIEGASKFRQLLAITIPMCTPMIFYNLIIGLIGSFQTFGNVFILTSGNAGADNSLLFYVMNIYYAAFGQFRIGYAAALSWFLFLIIGILTLIIFKTSKWVFYGEDV